MTDLAQLPITYRTIAQVNMFVAVGYDVGKTKSLGEPSAAIHAVLMYAVTTLLFWGVLKCFRLAGLAPKPDPDPNP